MSTRRLGEDARRATMVAMQEDRTSAELVSLLAWYREMGAETAVSEAASDWLARGDVAPGHQFRVAAQAFEPPPAVSEPTTVRPSAAAPAARAPSPSTVAPTAAAAPARRLPTESPGAAETEARRLARSAGSLDALEQILRDFDGCALKATAKSLCFWRGAPAARLMLIGEAPGRDEDLEGKPFVGRAGQLLDKMLAAAAIPETDVHITNVVYWRPPGNRTPTPQETQVCRPFLERQMELVAPDIVVLLGGAAAKHVLDVADGIMRLRGKWREIGVAGRQVRAMATLHPAYLLRTPAHKRQAWRDMLAVRAALDGA